MILEGLTYAQWAAFVLVLLRCGSLIVTLPFFGSANLPPMIKAGLCMALALLISFGCGWTNIVEKGMVERAGYHFSPTPGDENWYAELAHKIGQGKRIFRGDYQAFEASQVLTPYTAVMLPLGILGFRT